MSQPAPPITEHAEQIAVVQNSGLDVVLGTLDGHGSQISSDAPVAGTATDLLLSETSDAAKNMSAHQPGTDFIAQACQISPITAALDVALAPDGHPIEELYLAQTVIDNALCTAAGDKVTSLRVEGMYTPGMPLFSHSCSL